MAAVFANGGEWRTGYLMVAAVPVLMGLVYVSTARGWQAGPTVIPAVTRTSSLSPIKMTQMLLFFCYSGLELFFGRWCFTVLTELHGVSLELAGVATSCYFGSVFAGRLLLGALLDRVGADRMIRIGTGGVLLGGVLFAIGSPTVAIGALIVIGFSLAPIFPTMIARTGSRFPASQVPSMIAASVAAAILGSSSVPYFSGIVAANFGLSTMLFIPIAVACGLLASHETILRLHARQL
jgi:fucose permease